MATLLDESSKSSSTISPRRSKSIFRIGALAQSPAIFGTPDSKSKSMECSFLCDNDPSWDEFVIGHPSGTFFHLLTWREILRKSFGYEPVYLWVRDSSGRVRGLLPLFLVKSMLFGRSLVAMPVGVYGGAVFRGEKICPKVLPHTAVVPQTTH